MNTPCRVFAIAAFSLFAAVLDSAAGTIAGWDVNALAGGSGNFGPSPYGATSTDPNVTVGGFTRGSGVSTSGTAAARGWGGANWQATSEAAAIAANQYVTFSVMAKS